MTSVEEGGTWEFTEVGARQAASMQMTLSGSRNVGVRMDGSDPGQVDEVAEFDIVNESCQMHGCT